MADQIELTKGAFPATWDDYVRQRPDASLYLTDRWRAVVSRTFGHETFALTLRRDGALAGVVPLTLVSGWAGRMLVSPAYGRYGGVCADDAAGVAALTARAKELARELRVRYLELRHVTPVPDGELLVKTFKQTFWLDLPADLDVMWRRAKTEVRNRIRKAAALGCTSEVGGAEHLDAFYDVFARRMRDLGTPVYPRAFFANVLAEFGDDARIVVVRREGQTLGACVLLFYGTTAEAPWVASRTEAFNFYPNNALYGEAIRYSASRGCDRFDFGTSTVGSGHAEFKRRWGARPVDLHWQYMAARGGLPDLSPHNPKFSWPIRIWQRLPLPMVNVLGPWLIRGIP